MTDLFEYANAPAGPMGKQASADKIPQRVFDLFERFAWQLQKQGWSHYSADAILHRIRWHVQVDKGERDFKCNNNWTSTLSRWCMKKNPQLQGFFETRELKAPPDDSELPTAEDVRGILRT